MTSKTLVAAAAAVLLSIVCAVHAQDNGPYKVLKIQLVGGEGGYD